MSRLLLDARNPHSEIDSLTERESEVLHYVATGMSNQEIADQLVVSERTVRTHCSNILSKLNARNRTDAVRIGCEREWIDATVVKLYLGVAERQKYRNGETEPPDLEGYYWMEIESLGQREIVQIASSLWGEWRLAKTGGKWEKYLPHRLRAIGARWWGPLNPPFIDDIDELRSTPIKPKRPRAKLEEKEVVEIRRLFALGHSQQSLARSFGVSSTNVHLIVRHQTWKNVEAVNIQPNGNGASPGESHAL